MSPRRKKKKPNICELTEFNEIFSVDILMNKIYNVPVILFKNLSGQLTLNHVSLRRNTDSQRYMVQS